MAVSMSIPLCRVLHLSLIFVLQISLPQSTLTYSRCAAGSPPACHILSLCFSPILQNEGFVYRVAVALVVGKPVYLNCDNRETHQCTLPSRRDLEFLKVDHFAASCVLPKCLPEHWVSSSVFLLGSGWSSWIRITLEYFNRESVVNAWHLRGILGEGISLGCKLRLWYHFLPSCSKDRALSLFLFPLRFFSMNSLFLKLSQRSLF